MLVLQFVVLPFAFLQSSSSEKMLSANRFSGIFRSPQEKKQTPRRLQESTKPLHFFSSSCGGPPWQAPAPLSMPHPQF